jgi:hypothetical protein
VFNDATGEELELPTFNYGWSWPSLSYIRDYYQSQPVCRVSNTTTSNANITYQANRYGGFCWAETTKELAKDKESLKTASTTYMSVAADHEATVTSRKESDSATCSTQVREAKRASCGSLNGETLLFYQVRSEHLGLMPEFEAQLANNHGAWTREEPRRRPVKMVPWKPHPSAPTNAIPDGRTLRQGRAIGVYVDRWYWLAGDLHNGFGSWQEFYSDDAKLLTRVFSQGKNAGVICEVGPQGHKYTVCAAKPSDAVTVLNDDAIARGLAICEKGAQTIAGFALDVWSQPVDYSDGNSSDRSRSHTASSTRSSMLSMTQSSSL